MDIRHLRYFVAVVEHGSLTRAAERLHVAQPALGTHVKHLEEAFGVQLLVRHSRGVEPTREGRVLYERAGELLERFEALERDMRDLAAGPRGKVVVGVTPSLRNQLGPRLIELGARELPEVQLSLAEGLSSMLAEWLAAERIDVALLYDLPDNQRGVRGEALGCAPLYFVDHPANGRGADDGTIDFAELCRAPLAMPALRSEVLRQRLEQTAAAQGLELTVAIEAESITMVRELVLSGRYATALPYGALLPEIESGRLRCLRIVEPEILRQLYFCFSDRQALNKAGLAVRDLARRLAGELVAQCPDVWRPPLRRPVPA